MKQKKAFTLIELVVVVAIIAVLSVVGVVSFSSMNTKSRDARRVQDLQKIAAALEIFRQSDVGRSYPMTTASLRPNYLQIIPKDPKTKVDYAYNRTTPYRYTLTATLENAQNNPDNPSSLTYTLNSP